MKETDYYITESTYGNRLHTTQEPREELQKAIAQGIARQGMILIPAFAVDRTQEILYLIH